MNDSELDPVAALIALSDSALSGRPVAPVVAAWLAHGVREYIGGGQTLDRALGLVGEGWRASTRHAYRQRNAHIRRAFALVGHDVGELAAEVARFGGRTWPCWRTLTEAPDHATAVQRELWGAFKTCPRVPSSAKHLTRICRPG